MKSLYKLVTLMIILFPVFISAQTSLAIGDISIIGFNSNAPDNFTFVCWVNIANNTKIKFTDNGFLSTGTSTSTNNGRGGENFVIWTNNTGSTITAGAVIKIENGSSPSVGTVSQALSGISNSGDQISAYQGSGAGTSTSTSDWGTNGNPTTVTGTMLFGLNFQSAWLSTGTASSNTSYLPSDLNVTNGNIVHSGSTVIAGQYTGSRTNQSSMSGFRSLVNDPANWTTATSSTITLSTTAFTLTCTQPATQVSSLAFASTSSSGTTLSWTNGSGANTIVLAKSGSAVNSDPVSGTSYSASSIFTSGAQIGTGNYVIYNGSGTSVSVSGLSAGTTYHFAVYTYDSSGAASCVKVPGATANVATACSTPVNVSAVSVSNATNNKATLSWTNSNCFDEVYVFIDQTFGFGTSPSGNGGSYSANTVYSSNGQCVYKGTGSSITVTGLTNSSKYYFEIYTRKGTNWSSGVQDSATPVSAPVMSELVVPQYMASKTTGSNNDTRSPIAVCLQFDNLTASTLYDIKMSMALTSESSTLFGAGNIFDGSTYSGQVRLSAFTTNSSGSSGPVWLYIQPTGNSSRFGGGQVHELRVAYIASGGSFSSTPDFEGSKTITSLDVQTSATSTTADDGAFIKGTAGSSFSGKYVLAYNNISGTGDPLYVHQVMAAVATNTTQSGLPSDLNDVYLQSGTSAVGNFPVIVPIGANNTNGVRRFEFRNSDNTFFAAITDADGNWGTGMNTATIARKDFQTINLFEGTQENIRINGNVVLPGPLTLSGSLTFVSGKLGTSASRMLTLLNACTVSPSGGTSSMFVDGPMEWEIFGNNEVIFPLGKGTEWARMSILPKQTDARGTQARKYRAEYFKNSYGNFKIDTTQTNPLVVVDTKEYWSISEQSSATGSDLQTKIKLYWRTLTDVSGTASNRADLRVAHFLSSQWRYEGDTPSIFDNGVADGTAQSEWVSGFSPFTFGSISALNALPVQLVSLSAECGINSNAIRWQIAEDDNVNAFRIDRLQGNQYYHVATINSLNQKPGYQYVYNDFNGPNNAVYRISEIGQDNKLTILSAVKTICHDERGNAIRIIQTENILQVNFVDTYSQYTLNNILGQMVRSGNFEDNLNIDKAFLQPGIYILNIKELNKAIKIYVY